MVDSAGGDIVLRRSTTASVTGDTPTGRTASPPLTHAQPLREVLGVESLTGARVLAGEAGLDRPVERLNVMEVPDILPWVKPREFLLTTGYPLRAEPESLPQLVADLDAAGLSGLGIKLGRYLDGLPDGVLAVADDLGFPLVRLPDDVSFDEIFNEVLTGILNQQAEKLARSERIHRAFLQLVLRGQGLPEIVRDLADLLDGPAAIVGPDGEILASARLEALGLVEVGSPEPVLRLDLDPAAGSARAGDRELTCTAVAVSAGPRVHGHVVALGDGEAPTDDLMALENAATVAALAITKQMEVQAVEDKYRSDLMHDLLRGLEDPEDVRRRAVGFGWDLDRPLVALVLRLDDPPELVLPDEITRRAPLASAVRQLVHDRDPGAAVVRFSHEVVILTGAFAGEDGRARATAFARKLVREASRSVDASASAGVSRPIEDIADVARGYDQALRALVIGRRIDGHDAVAHFDDLGAYRLLSLVEDRAELRSFADEVLGPLAAEDETAADLRRTLQVLLETGGNVAEAARRLHFHYNTLRYRIDKLESILGPFTSDARVRLDVHLALLVLSMRGLEDRR
jgi:PucR family transcriptional regulator, purine catabolism regulatory protein